MRFGMEDVQGRVRAPDPREQTEIREAISELARPRLVGSPGAARVARFLRGELEDLGYEIRELPFSFSAWPGRFGVSAAGAVFLVGGVVAALLIGAQHGAAALVVLVLAAVAIGAIGRSGRSAIAALPWGRVECANWLVARPEAKPRYIIAAHRDSKGQPVPLFLRAAAIVVAALTWIALLVLALVSLAGAPGRATGWVASALGILAVVSGGILLLSWVTNDSPGALDNASGLAALVGIARREAGRDDVAFLITDGEELGLAGAAAVARELPPVFGIINLDGLDDTGEFHIIERHGLPRRGLAPHLAAALMGAAQGLGVEAGRRALPVGVMVDHVPLVEAGLSAVTLMRGTRQSLARVHRPEDSAARLSGSGAAAAVAVVSGALELLRGEEAAA